MTHPLIEGFKRFKTTAYKSPDASMPKLVSEGQHPGYYIISCGDSRSDPSTMFGTGPGEIFGFKPIGTIVRPYKRGTALASSLQFAMKYLEIPELIVIGHTECGAIKALVEHLDDPEIAGFIQEAQKSLDIVLNTLGEGPSAEQILRSTEQQVVLQSIENLKEYPSVAEALETRDLKIRGWIFDMKSGNILEHDQASGQFESLTNFDEPSTSPQSCGCNNT